MTLFQGSRLKIERANQHISDLNFRVREFAKNEGHTVCVEYDPETGYDILKLTAASLVPEGFALIIGDAVHNLRAALDFAIGDVEFATTKGRKKYTKFPVYGTATELKGAINGGLKNKIPQWLIDYIECVVQPYQGGNGDSIYSLHQLDIEDKHRLLIPYLQLTAVFNFRAEDDRGAEIVISPWLVTGEERTAIYQNNVKITNKGDPALGIFFEKSLPFMQGQIILPALGKFAADVTRIVDEIEAIYLRNNPT